MNSVLKQHSETCKQPWQIQRAIYHTLEVDRMEAKEEVVNFHRKKKKKEDSRRLHGSNDTKSSLLNVNENLWLSVVVQFTCRFNLLFGQKMN